MCCCLALAVVLIGATALFGTGPRDADNTLVARLQLQIGGLGFQPLEVIKVLLVVFLAALPNSVSHYWVDVAYYAGFGLLLMVYLFLSLYCCLLFHLKVETDQAELRISALASNGSRGCGECARLSSDRCRDGQTGSS